MYIWHSLKGTKYRVAEVTEGEYPYPDYVEKASGFIDWLDKSWVYEIVEEA